MSLMIFTILHPAAINDEQLDITATPKTPSNLPTGTVTITRTQKHPPCPLKADPNGILMNALCQSDGRQNGRRECAFDNELEECQHQ